MIALHAFVLPLHDLADVFGQLLLERFTIAGLRDILAALALFEYCEVGTARCGRLQIDPTTMDRSGDAAALLRIAAETCDTLLQLSCALGTRLGAFQKDLAQLRGFRVGRRCAKALFTVFGGLHEIVQNRDDVVSHGSEPKKRWTG